MEVRRYDEVVRLLASVLLGVGLRDYQDVVEGVQAIVWSHDGTLLPRGAAHFVALSVFIVFFRNVYGLIAYDAWRDTHEYEAPFEGRHYLVATSFLFSVAGALVLPSLGVYLIKTHRVGHALAVGPKAMYVILLLPVVIYVFWDYLWLTRFQGERRSDLSEARAELYGFTTRWCAIDGVVGTAVYCVMFGFANGLGRWTMGLALLLAAVIGLSAVVADYLSHIRFYFALPYHLGARARHLSGRDEKRFKEAYTTFHGLWGHVVPDGTAFCHWGGIR
jgi:hypothetical protein